MIYLYGKGKRFEIVKDLLKQNRVKQKIIAIDKNAKSYWIEKSDSMGSMKNQF